MVDVFESPNDVRDTGSIWPTAEKRHNAVGIFWPMIERVCRPAGFLCSLFIDPPSDGRRGLCELRLVQRETKFGTVPLDEPVTRADRVSGLCLWLSVPQL